MESSDKSERDSTSVSENSEKELKTEDKSQQIDDRITHHDEKRSMRRRVYKNLIALSISSLFHSSSQSGLHSLQTSLNSQTLGTVSIISSSAVSTVSSFFLPIIGFKLLGFKWTAIVAQFISISYIIANYFPSYYTLIPASIIHGLTDVTLMVLHSSLIAALAKQYSNFSTRRPELTLIKFFAISSAISHLSHIISSGISAIVFNESSFGGGGNSVNHSNYSITHLVNTTRKLATKRKQCGAMSCPQTASEIESPPKQEASIKKIFQLIVIYLVFAVVGIAILLIFLDNIKPTSEDLGTLKESLKKSFVLFKNIKIWLLLPVFLLMGSLMSFLSLDFSRYYVSCGYGISIYSIYSLVTGVSSFIFSILINQLAKWVNKTLMVLIVVLSIIVVIIYLHFWTIQTSVFVIYGLGGYFGMVEASWGTFLHATIGMVFYEQQTTAFTNFRFIVSIFMLTTLVTSLFLCSYVKIYIILVLAVFAFYSPIILEILLRYEKRNEKETKPNKLDKFLGKLF